MLRDFLHIFFPDLCRICSAALAHSEDFICTGCRLELPRIDYRNGSLPGAELRFSGKVNFKYTLPYLKFHKSGMAQKILHNIKYRGERGLAELLGLWFGNHLVENGFAPDFDLMVPVPLHKKKERLRGYNQSDCFARGMARATGIPYSERLLVRTVMNDTQTDKSRMERWKNVEGIFSVADESTIIGKRILLVDDVITTGATMEACAIPMFTCGAREISAAAIAIAQ